MGLETKVTTLERKEARKKAMKKERKKARKKERKKERIRQAFGTRRACSLDTWTSTFYQS